MAVAPRSSEACGDTRDNCRTTADVHSYRPLTQRSAASFRIGELVSLMSEPDVDWPEENSEADVTLVTRGITVTACVDESGASALVLRPTAEAYAASMSVKPGDPVEVIWVRGDEERSLPAQMSRVEREDGLRWHLTVTGPSERSQRRRAVRARVELDVRIPWGGADLPGRTVDLSEAGARVLVDGWGLPPDPGSQVTIGFDLDGRFLDLRGEVVWQQSRGAQWLMALRFVAPPEPVQDRLRRRVFQQLRDDRAKADR